MEKGQHLRPALLRLTRLRRVCTMKIATSATPLRSQMSPGRPCTIVMLQEHTNKQRTCFKKVRFDMLASSAKWLEKVRRKEKAMDSCRC